MRTVLPTLKEATLTTCTFGKILYCGLNNFIFFLFRGWKNLFEAHFLLYSPYYPFKDHDALCMTVKKATVSATVSSLKEHSQSEMEKNSNTSLETIYPGQIIIN